MIRVVLAAVFAALISANIPGETGNRPEENVAVAPTTAAEWRTFEATAYIALCDTGCTGFTRTEYDVRHTVEYEGRRVIAVDPKVIPLGTAVDMRLADGTIIEAIAFDTGGAIKGAKIDVLMAREADAWEFGRQAVEVRVVDEN